MRVYRDIMRIMINRVSKAYKLNLAILVLGPFIKLIEAIFDLLIPLFMKAIIDMSQYPEVSLIPNQFSRSIAAFINLFGTWIKNDPQLNAAIVGGVIILVMGIVGFSFTMISQYLAARGATNVGTEIRKSLFYKISHLNKKERDELGNGYILTCLNSDTYQIQQGVLFFTRLAVRAPFIITGSLVFSFLLDWKIGLAFTAIVPIVIIVSFFVLGKSSKEYVKIQEGLDQISSKSSDSIAGARVIRAFNKQQDEVISFEDITSQYERKSIKVHRINSLINPIIFAITALITILVVFLFRDSLLNGDDKVKVIVSSTIIAEMAYLAQIFFATTQLPPVLLDITKAGVSRRRIDRIFMLPDSEENIEKKFENSGNLPYISFKNAFFAHENEGNAYALKDISFSLQKGQTLGIIGGTGSGKTTIVNLIEKFYKPTKGDVVIDGSNTKEIPAQILRKKIALVNQKSSLFKGTIRSNFLMAKPDATIDEMTQVLKDAEAYEFVSKYSDYLDHEVKENGSNFSGGQKQRLCIARALLKNSDIIILDDSTSALDLITDRKIRSMLTKKKDVTKIIVSQRIATVKDADLILLLDRGSIIAQGKHEDLLKTSQIYKEINDSQNRKEDYEH